MTLLTNLQQDQQVTRNVIDRSIRWRAESSGKIKANSLQYAFFVNQEDGQHAA
jgi:hypothetical protein